MFVFFTKHAISWATKQSISILTVQTHSLNFDYWCMLIFSFTIAYEILGNKTKRRSFDSVDPQFDNDVPPADDESKKNFFLVFGPVFERNSRWPFLSYSQGHKLICFFWEKLKVTFSFLSQGHKLICLYLYLWCIPVVASCCLLSSIEKMFVTITW